METKHYIYIGIAIFSTLGAWLGSLLDNGNLLGLWSLALGTIGGLVGIWAGYTFANR